MRKINLISKKINIIFKSNTFIKLVIITLLVITFCIISILIQRQDKSIIKINNEEYESEYGKVCVYIDGAVKYPGMYKFNKGIILSEAINLIGGVKEKADITKLNLDMELLDKEKITIPEILEEVYVDIEENSISDLININVADEKELKKLPGIGDTTAKSIIEYRKNNKFTYIEDIMNVNGIGKSKFDKIKEYIITR